MWDSTTSSGSSSSLTSRTARCAACGSPTGSVLGVEDVGKTLCAACRPEIRRPRVTLYGAPLGQELARWTE